MATKRGSGDEPKQAAKKKQRPPTNPSSGRSSDAEGSSEEGSLIFGSPLTISRISDVASGSTPVFAVCDEALLRIDRAHEYTKRFVREGRGHRVYGLTSKLGHDKGVSASNDWGLSMLRHHATSSGRGKQVSPSVVRSALAVMVQGLTHGHTVVSRRLVMRLVALLNDELPTVDAVASCGSADIIQFAQALRGLVIEEYGFEFPGEALALISSNGFAIAHASLLLTRMRWTHRAISTGYALICEGIQANISPLRQYATDRGVAHVLHLLNGSGLWTSPDVEIQQSLSMRCFGQQLEAMWSAFNEFEKELTDRVHGHQGNPYVDWENDDIYSVDCFDTTVLEARLASCCRALETALVSLNHFVDMCYDRRVSSLGSGLESSCVSEDGVYSRCLPYHQLAATRVITSKLRLGYAGSTAWSCMSECIEDYSTAFPTAVATALGALDIGDAGELPTLVTVTCLIGATAIARRGLELGEGLVPVFRTLHPHVGRLSLKEEYVIEPVWTDLQQAL